MTCSTSKSVAMRVLLNVHPADAADIAVGLDDLQDALEMVIKPV